MKKTLIRRLFVARGLLTQIQLPRVLQKTSTTVAVVIAILQVVVLVLLMLCNAGAQSSTPISPPSDHQPPKLDITILEGPDPIMVASQGMGRDPILPVEEIRPTSLGRLPRRGEALVQQVCETNEHTVTIITLRVTLAEMRRLDHKDPRKLCSQLKADPSPYSSDISDINASTSVNLPERAEPSNLPAGPELPGAVWEVLRGVLQRSEGDVVGDLTVVGGMIEFGEQRGRVHSILVHSAHCHEGELGGECQVFGFSRSSITIRLQVDRSIQDLILGSTMTNADANREAGSQAKAWKITWQRKQLRGVAHDASK